MIHVKKVENKLEITWNTGMDFQFLILVQKIIEERKIQMGQNERLRLPDQRQIIHDLTLQKHASGLSPPEEEILARLEATEGYGLEPRSSEQLLREHFL